MSKSILVVDDSSIMRKMLVKVFKRAGHSIIGEASSGFEAIQLYKELHPDLVTMDITMRGMDGLTAAKEIYKLDENSRILILSNLDEEKYRKEAESVGAIGLVCKHKTDRVLELVSS